MRLLLFSALCLIWGSTWPVTKVGLNDFPPFLFAGMRAMLATLFLYAILKFRGEKLPTRWSEVSPCVVYGALNGLGFGLGYWGQEYIASSLAAILNATLPFFSAIFGYLLLKEELSWQKITGLLVGFSGIIAIFGFNLEGVGLLTLLAQLAIIIAAAVYAYAGAYLKKRITPISDYQAVTVQMASCALVLIVIGWPLEYNRPMTFTPVGVISLFYLTVFGSCTAYLLYYKLIQLMEISKVGYTSMVTPVVASLLGIIFLDEPFRWQLGLGFGLIMLGMGIVNYHWKKEPQTLLGGGKEGCVRETCHRA